MGNYEIDGQISDLDKKSDGTEMLITSGDKIVFLRCSPFLFPEIEKHVGTVKGAKITIVIQH
jgi:hypothetical protein